MKPTTVSRCAAVALFLVFLGSLSSYAVTETDASSGVVTNFDSAITPANLLHNRPIASTVSPDGFGTSVAPCWITGINDGAASFANNAGFPSGIGVYCVYFGADSNGSGLKSNPQVTISLDTVASPLGYDLTSITSIYGTTNLDRSYADQKYTVSYSTVTAPNTFIALTNVDYHPFRSHLSASDLR